MRQPVETQLRNYFEQIEETHGPLSTNVILDRSAPVQVIPESRPVAPPSRAIRKWAWAVALIVFAGVAILLGAIGSDTPSVVDQPVTTTIPGTIPTTAPVPATEVTPSMTGALEPGTYYVDPDGSPGTDMRVEFTIAEPGWVGFVGTYKSGTSVDYVAMKAQIVTEVASPACDSTNFVPVGETAEDLASALAEIEDFPSQEAPAEVNAYGYDGHHLVLEVPDTFGGCDDGYFDGYQGPTIGRYYQGPGQIVEFWVLDVEGTPLLIEATWFPDSPAEDVAQLQAILDSIVIRP